MDDEKQENQEANSRRSNPSTIRLTAEDIQVPKQFYFNHREWMFSLKHQKLKKTLLYETVK